MKYLLIQFADMWPIRDRGKTILFQKQKPKVSSGEIVELYIYNPMFKRPCTFCWGTGELDDYGLCPWCGGGDCKRYPTKVMTIKMISTKQVSSADITAEVATKAFNNIDSVKDKMKAGGGGKFWLMEFFMYEVDNDEHKPVNKRKESLRLLEPV